MGADDVTIKAHRQNHLWPSIHASVDVYYRRKIARGGSYELIWRLIHVWESAIITLASAAAAWLRKEDAKSDAFRGVRERLYGIGPDDAGQIVKTGLGALDGSIDKWIEVLNYFAKLPAGPPQSFFGRLQTLLNSGSDGAAPTAIPFGLIANLDLGPFIRSWERACDVPAQVRADHLSPLEAMRTVNSFRNRFAHVPFPYDGVDELHRHLDAITHQLFAVAPGAANTESVLAGSFIFGATRSFGGAFEDSFIDGSKLDEALYAFNVKKGKAQETWDAAPFIIRDEMVRSYVLTRLKNAEGIWEYTRYFAEANAVVERNAPELLQRLTRPTPADYPASVAETAPVGATAATGDDGEDASSSIKGMQEAFNALRERNFPPVIEFLKTHLTAHPDYHVGWLRLGYAQRELAVDYATRGEKNVALQMLREALVSFDAATGHRDPFYQADACYQRSKARWRLWMTDRDNVNRAAEREAALADARAAVDKSSDVRFATWLEFLEDFESRATEQSKDGPSVDTP